MEWVSMAERLQPSLTSTSATQSVRYCGAQEAAAGLQSTGDVFRGATTLRDESGFDSCQENWIPLTVLCQLTSVKFGGGGLWPGVVFLVHSKALWIISCSQHCGDSCESGYGQRI